MEIVLYADSVIQVTTTRLTSRGVAYPIRDIRLVTVSSAWNLQRPPRLLRQALALTLPLLALAIGWPALSDTTHWLLLAVPVAPVVAAITRLVIAQVRNGQRAKGPVTYTLEITGASGKVPILASTDKAYVNMLADTAQLALSRITATHMLQPQL